jgi:hypothetical protein
MPNMWARTGVELSGRGVRAIKGIDAPSISIIDGTRAFSAVSAKLLTNRRLRSEYLDHAQHEANCLGLCVPNQAQSMPELFVLVSDGLSSC